MQHAARSAYISEPTTVLDDLKRPTESAQRPPNCFGQVLKYLETHPLDQAMAWGDVSEFGRL